MERLRLPASNEGIPNQRKVPRVKATNIEANPGLANPVQIFAIIAKCLIHHVNAQHLVKLVINATKKATTLNVVVQMPLQTLDTPNLDSIGGSRKSVNEVKMYDTDSEIYVYDSVVIKHRVRFVNQSTRNNIMFDEIRDCKSKWRILTDLTLTSKRWITM